MIIESMEGSACGLNRELDPLQQRLQGKLRGRRFFLFWMMFGMSNMKNGTA